jgi:hypothetical protein
MSPLRGYALGRDIVLLTLGVILCLHEQLLTPPPFDLQVALLVGGCLTLPLTLRRDEKKQAS